MAQYEFPACAFVFGKEHISHGLVAAEWRRRPTGWGQGDNEEFASCRDDVGSSQLGEARLGSLVAEGRLPPVGSGTEGGVEPRQRHCPLHRAI